ncbi:MAG: hypothetical protein L0338_39670 [Acidobacteria bacterium]|nr:hypothetical protein [Acidobacteriota bacterium]
MASMTNTQSVALQLEKVRRKLPLLYERDDVLFAAIKARGDVERVSSRNMRIPLKMRPGGKYGQADMDGGDLGRGSGTTYDVATVTPIFFRFGIEITKLVEYATNSSEKAVANAAKKEVIEGMAQFRAALDKHCQTSGNGVLANITAVAGGGANITAAKATNPHGVQLLYFNQKISVYDSTLATNRGTATISAIDYDADTLTLITGGVEGTITLATIVVGDLILPDGVTGANPTSLFGLKFHQNSAATGTWLGLNRANFPEIRTPTFNAGGASLTVGMVRLALNKIKKALGINGVGKLMAYCNLEQDHAYEQLGVAITNIQTPTGKVSDLDLLFQGTRTMGGIPSMLSINADPTRIDFLDMTHWGRAVMQDIDYFEIGNDTIFPVYGASGGLATAYLFYFCTGFQIWTDSPRNGSFISNLQKPSGY